MDVNVSGGRQTNDVSKFVNEIASLLTSPFIKIACVLVPTIMDALRHDNRFQSSQFYLFEFDNRFAEIFGDHFVYFDYYKSTPPEGLIGQFDVVVVNPPVVSAHCQVSTAKYAKKLLKPDGKYVLVDGIYKAEELKLLYDAE